jgi:hypothetical protein
MVNPPFFVNVCLEGVHACDQHIHSQVPLIAVDQMGPLYVLGNDEGRIIRQIRQISNQENFPAPRGVYRFANPNVFTFGVCSGTVLALT